MRYSHLAPEYLEAGVNSLNNLAGATKTLLFFRPKRKGLRTKSLTPCNYWCRSGDLNPDEETLTGP
jgi:hypothetical protein